MEEFVLSLIEAGGLTAVAGFAIWVVVKAYKSREELMAQMLQQEVRYNEARAKISEEKTAFMTQTHAETLAMVEKLQAFTERQTLETAQIIRQMVEEGTEALTLNRSALEAVERALAQNRTVMERNAETWQRLMERVAS